MKTLSTASVILAIETCSNICSVALWDGEKLFSRVNEAERSHSKTLLPMIEALLLEANIAMTAVDFIACARGPGSFTGVRIGIGVAKGLAYGQDIPIIPVSPLQALAYGIAQRHLEAKNITAVLDARIGEVYAARYTVCQGQLVQQGQEMLTTAKDLTTENTLFGGTGALAYQEILAAKGAILSDVIYPLASDILTLAQQGTIEPVSAADFSPIYLRDKVTD